jgi:uncharacterized protein YqgC (DUF456 family)
MAIALNTIFSLLVALGLVMVFVPLLPAMLYMFIVTLIFAAVTDFAIITPANLAIFGLIVILNFLVDWTAGLIGARYGGASKRAIGLGIIGLVAGFILFPPFGGILGLFLGVLIAEVSAGKDAKFALRAASSSTIGALSGMAINFILALFYLIFFLFFLAY